MSTTTIATILAAAKQAAAILRDAEWDWAQDFCDAAGERHIIDGAAWIDNLPDETSREAAREYAEWTVGQFAEAVAALDEAIDAMESREDGWQDVAQRALSKAKRAEAEMGCANETGELADMLERALEPEDEDDGE